MDEPWFHIAHTPGGPHAHRIEVEGDLDPDEQTTRIGELVAADREVLGFPPGWLREADWSSAIAPGVPHPTLVARLDADCGRCQS